jgi:hypothetical protein
MTLEDLTAALQQHFPRGAVVFIVPASGQSAVAPASTQAAQADAGDDSIGLRFSQEEQDVLDVVDPTTWKTRAEISRLTGLAAEGDLRVLLRNLEARRVLESSSAHGYRLQASDAAPEVANRKTREIPPVLAAPAAPASPPFSRGEEDILAVLDHTNWKTRKEIAEATGMPPESDIKVLLRNLVNRGILESSSSKGYRLSPLAPRPQAADVTKPSEPKPPRRHSGYLPTPEEIAAGAKAIREARVGSNGS